MRSFVAYTLLASATLSVAVDPRFEYPDTVPLVKRQQPGTPQYACHEDCGLLITLAREEKDFCDSEEWNEHYDKCMECANTYGIWKYYGSGVSKVAEQCDLSPTPSPSGATVAEPTTSSAGRAEVTVSVETTTGEAAATEAAPTTVESKSAVTTTQPTVIPTHGPSDHDHTSVDEIGTVGITATSTPSPSSVVVNSAAKHFEFTTAIVFAAFAIYNLY